MITLPNGCRCSNPSVFPKNWQSKKAKITTNWYISYRFYDSRFPKPKLVMVKGMNRYKTMVERQQATQTLLAEELDKLLKGEQNPFIRLQNTLGSIAELTKQTPFVDALQLANSKLSVSDSTMRDMKYLILYIREAVKILAIEDYQISKVSRKIIKLLLEQVSTTPDRFNKNRSNLMILFSELCEAEAIDNNPVRDIKKKKVVKHLRTVLNNEERVQVNQYLLDKYPTFHRFLHIFFHSGARVSELIRLKETDLDMKNQRYKLVIQKGSSRKEVWKTIKDIALPYWNSLYDECKKGDYLFSVGLMPGTIQIKPYQITKRWYRLVKKKIGIEADFYSLKHLHTTEVVDLLNEKEAATHNEHSSTSMVVGIYDVKSKSRFHSKVKTLNNQFA